VLDGIVSKRIPVLYLAPWVDYGGSDTNTLDWFRWIDRTRFQPSLITTQPSSNRRLSEIVPFASEVWELPELMEGNEFPRFILEFVRSREIELIHLMNSRIGYDMLSDFRALHDPPKVVVQLHVEEPTRDGYVRYVTTRYAGLVDAFSVSSAVVGDAVVGYGISRELVEVVPTGIDADLFDPRRVSAETFDDGRLHLLFVARLVAQKDPLLMVEVARELKERGLSFCIHVIGGGDLEPDVRSLVERYGLSEEVVFEAATHELRAWYAGTDALLMTSVFEGVPVIVYEALAMELPIVAPALPGILELMRGGGGVVVDQRDRPGAYADALEPLLRSRELRGKIGAEGRAIVSERFSVQEMGAKHGRLYERLLGGRRRVPRARELPIGRVDLGWRRARGTPRVSVITPCFNHGRPLRECVESIRAQTYPDVELIVIDDCSTEAETQAYMRELEADDAVQVLRMPRNSGPSAARNRGIELSTGRYVLPVDADNLLLPDAIERLVTQLQSAGENVGFIYQNCQYFGNREDYFEPPVFNPFLLARENYIDTCALIDRSVFDHGFSYAEDIVFGHEDWDFFLTLAEHGIHGEPARGKTMLYRKEGFTRSDLVEWTGSPFRLEATARHPRLFSTDTADQPKSAPSTSLKAQWAPSLSLIALAPLGAADMAWETALARLEEQVFTDFELLVPLDREMTYRTQGPPVRVLPARLTARPAELLAHALEVGRGRNVLITGHALPDLLCDPGSIERIVRLLERRRRKTAFCFVDVRDEQTPPFAVTIGDERDRDPHSLAYSRLDVPNAEMPRQLDTGDPIGSLARWMQIRRHHLEWRHLGAAWAETAQPTGTFHRMPVLPVGTRAESEERKRRLCEQPALSGAAATVRRWAGAPSWFPAFTTPLVRSQRFGFEEWAVTSTTPPPDGFNPEYYLGVVHARSLQGTRRLVHDEAQGYAAVALGGEPTGEEMERSLGYVDEVAFTMLEPLLVCRHARTGAPVMICGEKDPLHGDVEWPPLAVLGYIDRLPINPHEVPTTPPTRTWLRGLIRAVDPLARRHRVGLGAMPAGRDPWELGALLDRDPGNGIAAWVDAEGLLHTEAYTPTRHPFDLNRTLRWVGAPASWRGFGRVRARSRAVARRGAEAARYAVARPGLAAPAGRDVRSLAWLLPDPGSERHPLFSATHPVTADQLVTRDPSEARELGYGPVRLLGYALAVAPVTGMLQRPRVAISWGSRFGESLTRSEDPNRAAE
jgi:glycosyltransferase involved in cell wall biosynthesis